MSLIHGVEPPDWPTDKCGCGRDLHYTQPELQEMMEGIVERKGPLLLVPADDGMSAYWIPRHFIVLHNVSEHTVAGLAAQFRFPKYEGPKRW